MALIINDNTYCIDPEYINNITTYLPSYDKFSFCFFNSGVECKDVPDGTHFININVDVYHSCNYIITRPGALAILNNTDTLLDTFNTLLNKLNIQNKIVTLHSIKNLWEPIDNLSVPYSL